MMADLAAALIQGGKLRPIAVPAARRSDQLPDVPTFAQAGGPAFEAAAWQGVVAPAGTPEPVIRKLSQAIEQALRAPEVVKQLKLQGMEPTGSTPEAFSAYARQEHERWGAVIQQGHHRRLIRLRRPRLSPARGGRRAASGGGGAAADAITMPPMASHWLPDSCSFSTTTPASAPMAGSMLSSTPKVLFGRRLSATISSEYGSALDSTPTAMPARIRDGSSNAVPAWAAPTGSATRAAAVGPARSPDRRGYGRRACRR